MKPLLPCTLFSFLTGKKLKYFSFIDNQVTQLKKRERGKTIGSHAKKAQLASRAKQVGSLPFFMAFYRQGHGSPKGIFQRRWLRLACDCTSNPNTTQLFWVSWRP